MTKTKSQFAMALITAALVAGITPLTAQQQQRGQQQQPGQQQRQPGQPGQQQRQPGQQQQQPGQQQEEREQISKHHRASELLNMSVQNQQGEELGQIEDVVIDYNTGQVGYVVLSTGTGLFGGGKLLAIPMQALSPAPQNEHLMLNVEKQAIDQAPGFSENEWPPIGPQAWGAAGGWGAQGAPRQIQQETQQQQFQPGQQRQQQPQFQQRQQQERLRQGQQQPGGPQARQQGQTFEGEIRGVNEQQNRFVVEGDQGIRAFEINPQTQIQTGEQGEQQTLRQPGQQQQAGQQQQQKLSSLQPGTKVKVEYERQPDGTLVAQKVMVQKEGQGGQQGQQQGQQERQQEEK